MSSSKMASRQTNPPAYPGRDRAQVSWVRLALSATLLAMDLVVLVFTIAGIHGSVRFALGLLLGGLVPGWAVVGLLRLRNVALEASLTVAVSLALLMFAAQLLITVDAWDLGALEVGTCIACVPSLAWQSLGFTRLGAASQ